ncbi:MAG: Rpn family recombination-promoting nuclease/putative transposase [Planctomycetaceae bacterium]|jgi:flagellar biosynthesis/type III secretory pathway protein FliH|nr:Rpn family recombination-promoting nuclease/putative transposase [Planctomycetaceae bacterium]
MTIQSDKKIDKHKKKRSGNIYDAFVKNIFGQVIVFADFLKNYADPEFVRNVKLSAITPSPTHYFGLKGDERILDLVFRCPLKNGTNTKAVIVFEHTGNLHNNLPVRLIAYAVSIWLLEIKENKPLSAIYFIVLRTGKKPRRRPYKKLADLLPKDRNGQPIGWVPDVRYDMVDLPAEDIEHLRGGAVLRVTLGILKKMAEGLEEEFDKAMLPLAEIDDENQQIVLTKEILDLVAKVYAVRKKRLESEAVHKSLTPIFQERTQNMIPTIFDEIRAEGRAEGRVEGRVEGRAEGRTEGRAEGKVEGKTEGRIQTSQDLVLTVLQTRFKRVPKKIEGSLKRISNAVTLKSLVAKASVCQTLDEFVAAVK